MNTCNKTQAVWLVLFLLFAITPGWCQPVLPQKAAGDSIVFDADEVVYHVQTRRVELIGNATLRYRDLQLKAGHITYDQNSRHVTARALSDSTGAKTVGPPQFTRGSEKISGESMVYDLDTERGSVRDGRASHQRKHYRGAHIALDGQEALNALDLSLSTCDRDHVHYDFLCKNVRILQNDKAIGRSVTFRIGPIPVFWFPFLFFQSSAGGNRACLHLVWVATAAMVFLYTIWDIISRPVNIGMPRLRVPCASAVDSCSNRALPMPGATASVAQWISDTTTTLQVMVRPTIGASICNTSNASTPRPISGVADSFPPVPILTDAIAIIFIAISIGS